MATIKATFVPEIWETALLYNLRKNLVLTNLCNDNYTGTVQNVGDVVHINTPAAITTSAYAGTVTYQVPTGAGQDLLINQNPYWAFRIEDLDALQSNVNLIQAYTEEGSYSMADHIDQDIASLYTAATSTTTLAIHTNSDGVGAAVAEAGRKLSELNVPTQGRWMVLNPATMEAFVDYYGSRATVLGDDVSRNGYVMTAGGFDMYMSNNIVTATNYQNLYGTNAAITLAMQDTPSVEAMKLETAFGTGVRAQRVYGRKVVRPDALGVLVADFTA